MNFFGLMNFQAPYLPWVLCGFSVLLGGSSTVDIMGKLLNTNLTNIYLKNNQESLNYKELLLVIHIII